MLQQKPEEEDKEKDGQCLPETRKRARRMSDPDSRSSRAQASADKMLTDAVESSAEPALSEFDGSDNEDNHGIPSSDMEDDDIFKGVFAIKDKDRTAYAEPLDRFASLPSRIKKELQNFQQEVLDSIPQCISECLLAITLL